MASLRAHSSYEPAIGAARPRVARGFSKLNFGLMLYLLSLPVTSAAPSTPTHHRQTQYHSAEDALPNSADDASLWVYLGTAAALVILGGAFAGLTIA